jgi:hypothetical protein
MTPRVLKSIVLIIFAVASSAMAFNSGDRVQIKSGVTNVNVRTSPSTTATVVGQVSSPTKGTVQSGPYSGSGFTWYNVNWDTGVNGYTVQDYYDLAPASAPALSSISPNPVTGSTSAQTFTLTGSSFVSGAKVQVAYASNGYTFVNTNTNATFVSSTKLTVPITTSTTADTWKVRVQNPDGQLSGQINLVVNAPAANPPTLNSISPNPVTGSTSAQTFTLSGSSFVSGAKVQVAYASNGYTFVNTNTNATFVSSSQLTVPITTSTTADTWKVRVQNPDGQLSGQINLVVNAPAANPPTLNSISPNPVTGSTSAQTFTLSGSNFVSGAKVQVAYASNGYTFVNTNTDATFVSASQLTVPITTSTTADTWKVRVVNPDGQVSGQINLSVIHADNFPPNLTSISPNPVTGSATAQTFTLSGSNFVSGAKVQVAYASNGYTFVNTNTNATFVSSTQLTVPITTSTTADTWKVRVQNPDGQLSGQVNLVVNGPADGALALSTIAPNPVTGANTPLTFTITGSGFLTGAKVQVAYASNGYAFVNTKTDASFVSSTQLTVPITTTTQADTWHVRIQNPDGMLSNQVNLVVNAPATNAAPILAAITPNPVTGSNNPITFTLTGGNFVSGAKVKVAYASNGYSFVNTAANSTFVSSTKLTVPITTSTISDAWRVRVQNPDNQLSGEVSFVVNAPGTNPAPIVSGVNPNPTTGSSSQRTFTISGSNFVNGAVVQVAFRDSNYQFRNTNTAASFSSSSQLTVPITTGTTADTWRLRVQNPTGLPSNEMDLLITPPAPTSAPAIPTYPNPSTNIYDSVPSFVANEGSNFAPLAVPTYLSATTQALEPLHPSRLKAVLSKISVALHGLGTVANFVDASNASNLTDFTKASLGVLLHYLPKDTGTRLAQNTLTAASLIKIIEEKNPTIALVRLNILIYGKILPNQIDEFVAADPPDAEYQSVVDPEPVTNPDLPSSGDLQLDAFSRNCFAKQMDAASFLKAATITYNRYSTAYSANDPLSAGLQLQALLNYLHLYDQALKAAADDTMQINARLSQSGMVDHGVDVATLSALQQQLASGLPHEVIQILGDHGYTAEDMEAARQQFLALDTGTLGGTLFGSLAEMSQVSFHGTSQTPGEAGNISTRLNVGTGDNVLIGGFIITGAIAKKVIIRGIGPSLSSFGISNGLADPTLDLYDSGGRLLASNDNWRDSQAAEIRDSGVAPNEERESAIVVTLTPGAYTAIVSGLGNTTGVGSVEIYDLDNGVGSKLANISTRGLVTTGDNVMIGGTIVIGNTAAKLLIRALGPSLAGFGIRNTLQNPTLELHDSQGGIIASNDDWGSSADAASIATTGLQPTDNRESAILATLTPGAYTAVVRGAGDSTGVGIVEAYQLSTPTPTPTPNVTLFQDNFDGNSVDTSKWTVENGGSADVANGITTIAAGGGNWSGTISTLGNVVLPVQPYTVEFRARRTGDYDLNFNLTDGTNTLNIMESSHYLNVGFRLNTSGAFGVSNQGNGNPTTAWKEYRITVDGTTVTAQRGDSLSNLTETLTETLADSAANHPLFLRMGNAGPNTVEVDWVKVTSH